jgi:Protein of unknown function (DUF3572)
MSKCTKRELTYEEAETIALEALSFLAEDTARLARFLSMTGLGLADLRAGADNPCVLASVLGHLMEDESLLLVFSSSAGIAPESIGKACGQIASSSRNAPRGPA